MQRYSISQLPVVRNEPAESLADVVGSLRSAACSTASSRTRTP